MQATLFAPAQDSRALFNDPVAQPASSPQMAVLSAGTTADIEQRQVEAWRRLSSVERLRLVSDTTRAVMELSLAGIRHAIPRRPNASVSCAWRPRCRHGSVYPDASHLTDLRGAW